MFTAKAMPRMAALEREAAWVNAPIMPLSFSTSRLNTHTPPKITVVTAKQNRQNAG